MTITNTAAPIGPDEASGIFAGIPTTGHLAIAVSGGADSVALMRLLAIWGTETGAGPRPRFTVLTVDHGLRPEAAGEAAQVGKWARGAGLEAITLPADNLAPVSGIQAWARGLRYRLMGDWVRANGARGLVLAHHAEDQAETFAMRLARGSGLKGLAAMTGQSVIDDLTLYRPLLNVPKVRLAATLAALGQDWVKDPSNSDPAFERVRMRAALGPGGVGEAMGLSASALSQSARRLARADAAVEHMVAVCWADAVHIDPWGFAIIGESGLATAPEEVGLRVLARVIGAVGGQGVPRGSPVEAAWAQLAGGSTAVTLGGCRIGRSKHQLIVTREIRAMPDMRLPPGQTLVWDRRFDVTYEGSTDVVQIRPLGVQEFSIARAEVEELKHIPSRAGRALPGGFLGQTLTEWPNLTAKTGQKRLIIRFRSLY